MKTAVVILNYNGLALLQSYLPGVVANSLGADVIVADNGSTDGSVAWIKASLPEVKCLSFGENYGFAEGYNRAINQLDHDYVVLLNSDVEVTSNWLTPLITCLESDDKVAACMPKIRSERNKSYFEYAGASGGFIDSYGYPFCRGRIMEVVEEDDGQYDTPIPVFWSTGACLCIKRAIYIEVGGLDSDFFAHMEEIDLCWRLNARGYSQWCIPESVVYHVGGATLDEASPRKSYLNFRNNAIMLYKNLPYSKLCWVGTCRLFLDIAAALHLMLQGKSANGFQVLKARWDYWIDRKSVV